MAPVHHKVLLCSWAHPSLHNSTKNIPSKTYNTTNRVICCCDWPTVISCTTVLSLFNQSFPEVTEHYARSYKEFFWDCWCKIFYVLDTFSPRGVPRGGPNPLQEKIVRQKRLILFTTLHIKLHSGLQWRRNALNILWCYKSTDLTPLALM